jgi:hypothetical protein
MTEPNNSFCSLFATQRFLTTPSRKLNETTQDAFFLFDDRVDQYVQSLREKGAHLRHLRDQLADESLPIGEKRSALSAEDAELLIWFTNQFIESKVVFKKYLRVL